MVENGNRTGFQCGTEGVIKPFLKWPGGKRWFVNGGHLQVPSYYERYVDPFLGGGAVLFHLNPARALVSDLNSELIDLYHVMRGHPEELWHVMNSHQANHSAAYYYHIRSSQPDTKLDAASRTLYLNRTCWNGLYRVNLKGDFNVPKGSKDTVVFSNENFRTISERLNRVDIRTCDFSDTIREAGRNDFIFADPPYTVKHNYNNFLKYNENIFSWDDQQRLRDVLDDAASRGCKIAVTNADHEAVRSLYRGFGKYRSVSRKSVLSADATRRRGTTEAVFVNFRA